MDKGVNVRNHSGSSRAKTLWKMRDAKERGDTYCDQSYATKIEPAKNFAVHISKAQLLPWRKRCGERKCGASLAPRWLEGTGVEFHAG